MRTFILNTIMALLITHAVSVSAFDIWFKWTPNPSNELVTGYVIQQSTGVVTNFIDVVTAPGTTNAWPIRNLASSNYKFRLVAVNGAGRSDPSNILSYPTNVPSAPLQFEFTTPR